MVLASAALNRCSQFSGLIRLAKSVEAASIASIAWQPCGHVWVGEICKPPQNRESAHLDRQQKLEEPLHHLKVNGPHDIAKTKPVRRDFLLGKLHISLRIAHNQKGELSSDRRCFGR